MKPLTATRRSALIVVTSLFLLSVMLARETKAQGAAADVLAATPEYDLTIKLTPDAHRMEVAGTVFLPPSDEPRAKIELALSGLMKDFRVEVLEPEGNAGPVDATMTESKANPLFDIAHWTLQPKQPFASGKPVRLRLSYHGGEGFAFTFYLGPEGSFGGPNGYWYPQFDGGRGKGRLTFSVPFGYKVLSTGAEQSRAADEANGNFEFTNSVPTSFAFAAGRYTVRRRDGVVPMRIYLLRDRPNAESYLEGAAKVLSTLTKEFGPYPYAEFAIAEVPSEQARAASFSGASMNGFMLADTASLDSPFNLAFYGHEIGHQWWGNLVTHRGSPRGDYMLDEALAQFGSLRVVEMNDGAVAAEQYRRVGYTGYSTSQCGYGYLLSTESGLDHALGDLPNNNWSHELADSKGFLVLDLLSRTVGRGRFGQVLRNITNRYAFRSVSWDEFLAAVQAASKEDLGWFFSQWFERTGAPDWQVMWKQEGGTVRGEVTQSAPFYRQNLEVELTGADGERATHTLEVKGARTEFAWPAAFRVRSVVLDPHFYVLHWLPELRAGAKARGPALRAFQLSDAGKVDEAEAVLRQALANLPQPDAGGARYWAEYSLAYMFVKRKDWAQAEQHFDAALAAPTRDADTLPVLYWRYAQAAKNMHDDAKMRWAVEAAVSADVAAGGRTGAQYWATSLLTAR